VKLAQIAQFSSPTPSTIYRPAPFASQRGSAERRPAPFSNQGSPIEGH